MRIIIYKSNYNWAETIEYFNSLKLGVETEPIDYNYYTFDDFEIETNDEDTELKLIIKPFFKRKSKEPLDWQLLLEQLINPEERSLDKFMPDTSFTFDSVILMREPGSQNNNVYLITFGQAYHDINDIIDFDFGIDFAEKAISNENVTTKNVNFFQQNRLKEITNYRRNSVDFARPTESYTSISGYPEDKERYGNSIHCSLGVSFLVPNGVNNFKTKLCKLIHNVDELITRGAVVNPFPRLKIVRDDLNVSILDELLLDVLVNPEENNISTVDLSRLIEFQNYIFLLDEMNEVKLFTNANKRETETTLSDDETYIEFIMKFLLDYEITDINTVRIEITDGEGYPQVLNLKDILHAEVNDNGKHYLLQNGKWGTFNQEFFDILNNYLDEINLKQNTLNSKEVEFNKTEEEFIFQFQIKNSSNYKVLHKHFIQPKNKNFIVKGNGVELADLYSLETNELITVKKGVNTSLSLYSLEQSMLAMNSLNHMSSYDFSSVLTVLEKSEFEELRFSTSNSVIWMLPLRKSDNTAVANSTHTNSVIANTFDLKDLGSVLLKNKLVEWAQFSIENRLKPTIYMECPIDLSK